MTIFYVFIAVQVFINQIINKHSTDQEHTTYETKLLKLCHRCILVNSIKILRSLHNFLSLESSTHSYIKIIYEPNNFMAYATSLKSFLSRMFILFL